MVGLALLFLVGGGATVAKALGRLAARRGDGPRYVLTQVRQVGETGPALIPLLAAAAAAALVLTLVTGDGRRWLLGA